eukprot:gene13628-19505_t
MFLVDGDTAYDLATDDEDREWHRRKPDAALSSWARLDLARPSSTQLSDPRPHLPLP